MCGSTIKSALTLSPAPGQKSCVNPLLHLGWVKASHQKSTLSCPVAGREGQVDNGSRLLRLESCVLLCRTWTIWKRRSMSKRAQTLVRLIGWMDIQVGCKWQRFLTYKLFCVNTWLEVYTYVDYMYVEIHDDSNNVIYIRWFKTLWGKSGTCASRIMSVNISHQVVTKWRSHRDIVPVDPGFKCQAT